MSDVRCQLTQLSQSSQAAATHEATEEAAQEDMEDQMEEVVTQSRHFPITNFIKLAVFQLITFKQDTEKAHPNVCIQIKDNGVHSAGADRRTFVQIKHSILDYIGKMVETHFTLEREKREKM